MCLGRSDRGMFVSEWKFPCVEMYSARTDSFHVRHLGNKGTTSIQERVFFVEGGWFQATSFLVWGQLFTTTPASEITYRLRVFWPSISQDKLVCRFLQSIKDWGRIVVERWKTGSYAIMSMFREIHYSLIPTQCSAIGLVRSTNQRR